MNTSETSGSDFSIPVMRTERPRAAWNPDHELLVRILIVLAFVLTTWAR